MEWLFFFLCSYATMLCFSTSQPRVTLQRLHTRSNLSIRHLLGLDIRSQKVCKGIPISSAIPLQPQIWNSVAASLMLSLISDISVFKLFTSQYYFLRHIYTVCIIRMVMPFIRLQVQKLITMRVAGTMPLFACIRSCMAFYHLFFYPTDGPSGQIGAKIGVSGGNINYLDTI